MFTSINKALDASRLKREENQKGFTLIELLVVVIIIGILAAIAIPVFLNQRESAWKASVESDLKNASLAIETYGADHNGAFTGITTTDITGGAVVVGTGTTSTFKVSDGNTLKVTLVGTPATSYIIKGKNANLPTTAQVLTYNSNNGGLGSTWGSSF